MISFELEGIPYTATFAGKICNGSVSSRLDFGPSGALHTLGLTVLVGLDEPSDAGSAPQDLTYFCF